MATHYHKPALSMQVLFAWCHRLQHFIDCALGDGSLRAYVTLETLWHEFDQGWTKPLRVPENRRRADGPALRDTGRTVSSGEVNSLIVVIGSMSSETTETPADGANHAGKARRDKRRSAQGGALYSAQPHTMSKAQRDFF
jgi:hypothetical protein